MSAAPTPSSELEELISRLQVERKIAGGAEHLLQLFANDPRQSNNEALRRQVETELNAATDCIRDLERAIGEIRGSEEAAARTVSPAPSIPHSDQQTPHSVLGLESEPTSASQSTNYGQQVRGMSDVRAGSAPVGLAYALSPPPPHQVPGRVASPAGGLGIGLSPSPSAGLTYTFDSPQCWSQPAAAPSEQYSHPSEGVHERSDARSLLRQAVSLLYALQMTGISFSPNPSSSVHSPPDVRTAGSSLHHSTVRPTTRTRRDLRRGSGLTKSPPNTAASRSSSVTDLRSNEGPPRIASEFTKQRLDLISRLITIFKRHVRVRYELEPSKLNAGVFPCLSEASGVESRAAAYSLLRHSIAPPGAALFASWKLCGLEIYFMRTFLRDNRSATEKEQALKLIRAIVDTQFPLQASAHLQDTDHVDIIGPGLIRAMIAAAEHSEEKMRHIFLETLTELAVYNLPLLLRGGGLATVLHALHDGPSDLAPAIAQVLIFLADMPSTRLYLRPGLDLEFAISGFTDLPAQTGISYAESLRTSAQIVGVMLRSWTGLLYLSMYDRRAVSSLVTALKVSPVDVQEAIISMLVSIFDVGLGVERQKQRAKAKERHDLPELDAVEGRPVQSKTARELSRQARERNQHKIGLLDQYLSLLLVVLIESGLVDALVHILETCPESSRNATLLMGALLQVGNRVLPQFYNVHVHQLPTLFAGASKLHDPDSRRRAVTALSAVDKASALLQSQAQSNTKPTRRDRAESMSDDPLRRGQRQVDKVKMLMGMQIDESTFRNLLLETQVLNTRDHTKWNIEGISELLQGPLLNPRRLEEAIRATKLPRRLLAFYHPFSQRFSDLPATPPNRIYIRLGCTMLNTFLSSPEGIKFLAEDRLLREIKEAFDQIDPLTGATATDPILAKSRITSTLSQGYLEMIGTLSASAEGVKLLSRFHIWSSLYRLCQLRSRDDLVKVMIEKLDYALDGHPRILLGWCLTSANRPLRKFATDYLARLIRRTPTPGEWKISLLLTQLCDPASSIRDIAVAVVKEVCSSPETLEMVVSLRPTLDHLGETGHELLLRFLSTPGGLRYLLEGDYIDREMDEWFNERNHRYAVKMEVDLSRALSIYRNKDDPELEAEFGGAPPPHFYGELAKTSEGCEVMNQKGHFLEFAHFIRQHGMEGSDLEVLGKLKSILWAVGSIGATAGGFPFLEADGTVANIVDIAENSPVLSVRGTCFYVIGLISTSRQGAELLQDYGWHSACTAFGTPVGICIPEELDRFINLPPWDTVQVPSQNYPCFPPPQSPVQRSILASLSNLGNSILANKASKTLSKLKHRHRAAFADLTLFVRALELMNSFKLRQVIRKYIWDLFEIELDQDVSQKMLAIRMELFEAGATAAEEKCRHLLAQNGSASAMDQMHIAGSTSMPILQGMGGNLTSSASAPPSASIAHQHTVAQSGMPVAGIGPRPSATGTLGLGIRHSTSISAASAMAVAPASTSFLRSVPAQHVTAGRHSAHLDAPANPLEDAAALTDADGEEFADDLTGDDDDDDDVDEEEDDLENDLASLDDDEDDAVEDGDDDVGFGLNVRTALAEDEMEDEDDEDLLAVGAEEGEEDDDTYFEDSFVGQGEGANPPLPTAPASLAPHAPGPTPSQHVPTSTSAAADLLDASRGKSRGTGNSTGPPDAPKSKRSNPNNQQQRPSESRREAQAQRKRRAAHKHMSAHSFSQETKFDSSLIHIDGFGERKGAGWTEPQKLAPTPGVRIIGGFGEPLATAAATAALPAPVGNSGLNASVRASVGRAAGPHAARRGFVGAAHAHGREYDPYR